MKRKKYDEGVYPALKLCEYSDIPPDCKGLYFFKFYDHTAEEERISKHQYRIEKIKQEAREDAAQG
jgi:hypothetical protein